MEERSCQCRVSKGELTRSFQAASRAKRDTLVQGWCCWSGLALLSREASCNLDNVVRRPSSRWLSVVKASACRWCTTPCAWQSSRHLRWALMQSMAGEVWLDVDVHDDVGVSGEFIVVSMHLRSLTFELKLDRQSMEQSAGEECKQEQGQEQWAVQAGFIARC